MNIPNRASTNQSMSPWTGAGFGIELISRPFRIPVGFDMPDARPARAASYHPGGTPPNTPAPEQSRKNLVEVIRSQISSPVVPRGLACNAHISVPYCRSDRVSPL